MVGQEKQTLLERVVVVTETSLNKCTTLDLIKFIKWLN